MAALVWALSLIATGSAAPWSTGVELRQRLEAPVDIRWPDNPLRSSLANLASAQGVAIFLDRRIDPGQSIRIDIRVQPLRTALDHISAKVQGGAAVIGPLVYIAPSDTANKLATLAALRRQEAALLSSGLKAKLLKAQGWRWEELSRPRDLLAQLADEAGLTIENPQLVSHDLWPAADLPPLTLSDRLTILLAGFGLTFSMPGEGLAIRLEPMPDVVTYEHTYVVQANAAKVEIDLNRIFPEATLARTGSRITIAAPFEDHEKIERLLRGETVRQTQTKSGEKRYTLKVENQPAGAVIKTVARDLGKEMTHAPDLMEKLNTKVTLAVKDSTLDDLLKSTLVPLGLTYRLTDAALEIVPLD